MARRRGVRIVVGVILVAAVLSGLAMGALYFLLGRGPTIESNSMLVLHIREDLAEVEPSNVVNQLLATPLTLRSVVDNLRKAKVDSRIKGVLVLPTASQNFWGKVQEVRDAIADFRRSGKPIAAFLEYGDDQQYYLATACDKIYLEPSSPLYLDGIASYELFFRGTLDKIGTYPDLLHIGEYKTFSNNFTEKTFTPAHREMAQSLNRDLYEQLVRAVAEGRKKKEEDVMRLIDEGPFLPEDAVRAGLVDDLAYLDQVDEKLALGKGLKRIESDEYRKVPLTSLGLNSGPRIAVVYAVGLIASGESRADAVEGAVAGSETIVEYLRKARDDGSIKAIVLRVDSPGGSAVASDVIWREVVLARNRKPLVASMSDLAASGGYYIAMPAQSIVAQAATLTGSIGVVMGKFVTGGTYNKLGMTIESVSDGKFADLESPTRPYSPEERAKMEQQMQAGYDDFVEKAAEGRHTTPEKIDAVAQGRVWTGHQAKQLGLVDDLGGLGRALALAKQRANIPQDAEVELVIYPPKKGLLDLLSEGLNSSTRASLLSVLLATEERRALATLTSPVRLFRRGEPLALMPNIFVR